MGALKERYEKIVENFFGHVHRGRGLGLGIDMRRDWKMLSAAFLVLVFFILVFDIYLFYFSSDQMDGGVDTQSGITLKLDELELKKVVKDWQERGERLNSLFGEKTVFIDPSL